MDPRYLPTDFNGKLAKLSEECHEVGQMAMKAIRFGILNEDPRTGISNLQKIIEEMGDLQHAYLQVFEHVKGEHKKEQIKQFRSILKERPKNILWMEVQDDNYFKKMSKEEYLKLKEEYKGYLKDLNTFIFVNKKLMKNEDFQRMSYSLKIKELYKFILENNIEITYDIFRHPVPYISKYSNMLQTRFKKIKSIRKSL